MNLGEAFSGIIDAIVSVLPTSPFQDFLADFASLPFLGYLNWFFPVRGCLIVMVSWLTAIAVFYLYSIIMRWVKMIGD